MARRGRKSRRGGSRKMTIPLSLAAPVVALGIEAGGVMTTQSWSNGAVGRSLVYVFTGVKPDGGIDGGRLMQSYGPMVVGLAVHKFVGPSVNKALARAKVPFIRL